MRKKVLIIDDEDVNLELLDQALSEFNVITFKASSGEQALQLIKEIVVDLIMVDLQMPGLDGYQVIQGLKRIPQVGKVPIVVVSGSIDKPAFEKVQNLGVENILVKPINLEILQRKLKPFLISPG